MMPIRLPRELTGTPGEQATQLRTYIMYQLIPDITRTFQYLEKENKDLKKEVEALKEAQSNG